MFIRLTEDIDHTVVTINIQSIKYYMNSRILFTDGDELCVIEDDEIIHRLIMNTTQYPILSKNDL